MNGLNEATKFHSKSFNRNFFPSWKHFSSKEFIIEIKSATPNRISFYSIILSNTKRKVERKKNSFSFDQVRMIKKSPLQTLVSDDSQWAKGRYYSAAVAAAYRLVFVRARARARASASSLPAYDVVTKWKERTFERLTDETKRLTQ
jgi:hypothetical protein